MHFTSSVTAALALAGSALATPAEKRATVGLSKAMRQRGRSFIGTALTLRGDDQELAIVENKADFNSITPENAQKWDATEPQRGNFTFDDADRYVDFATDHGYQIHCHVSVRCRDCLQTRTNRKY